MDGKAVERIFLPLMKLTLPEIVDINLPPEGVFHNLMIVSIRKSYPGHARKVMNGIWAMGQAMFTKIIIVVDEGCDVQDLAEVTLRRRTTSTRARHPIHARPGRLPRPRQPPPQLRLQDGHRRHQQMARRRLTRPWPRCSPCPRSKGKSRRPLEETRHRLETDAASSSQFYRDRVGYSRRQARTALVAVGSSPISRIRILITPSS